MNSKQEYVVLVDSNDQELGQEEKLKTHQLGLLHRAFSVLLFKKTEAGLELLLQQRNQLKYHAGGLWTNTCCSHPRPGEGVVEAASRRLYEEMGIKAELSPIGRFQYRAEFDNGLIEHELDYVLIGWYGEQSFEVNPEEVMAFKWVTIEQLRLELTQHPEQFTPWFAQALDVALECLYSEHPKV